MNTDFELHEFEECGHFLAEEAPGRVISSLRAFVGRTWYRLYWQGMSDKIDKGGQFPDIELAIVGGGSLRLPAGIDTPYAFILFYRGHW